LKIFSNTSRPLKLNKANLNLSLNKKHQAPSSSHLKYARVLHLPRIHQSKSTTSMPNQVVNHPSTSTSETTCFVNPKKSIKSTSLKPSKTPHLQPSDSSSHQSNNNKNIYPSSINVSMMHPIKISKIN
jgi:hypothetical protein